MAGSRLTEGRRAARGDLRLRRLPRRSGTSARYPTGRGYDAADHMAYADGLVPGWQPAARDGRVLHPARLLRRRRLARLAAREARRTATPTARAMVVNVLFLLGTVLLVAAVARELWPGRRRIELGAAAFVALLPVAVEAERDVPPGADVALPLHARAVALCPHVRRPALRLGARGRARRRPARPRLGARDGRGGRARARSSRRRWRELASSACSRSRSRRPGTSTSGRVRRPAPFPQPAQAKPLLERRLRSTSTSACPT